MSTTKPLPALSIIVPSLGDSSEIIKNILPLTGEPAWEILVIEAGKPGPTMEGAIYISSPKQNRGYQMNLGALHATGELLLFLHADTFVTPAALKNLCGIMKGEAKYAGGAFRFALGAPSLKARIIEWGVRFREKLCRLPYGDQGIFVRKSVFERIGGYKEVPILEDVLFVQALQKQGKFLFFREKAVTSPRKWERRGYLKMTLLNWRTILQWKLGFSLERIAKKRG